MRILYWHRTLADGAEGVHIAAMVDAFRALGHNVRLADLGGASPNKGGQAGVVALVRAALPKLVFELASIGYNIPEYLHVRREIARFRPHILYARHARYDTAALAAARRAGVPTLLEVNALFTAPGYLQFEPLAVPFAAKAMERRSLRLATAVVTVSTPLARQAESMAGVHALVVPNGADPQRFDPLKADGARVRTRFGLGTAVVIGWTGILREWHGLELLVDALKELPTAMLLIVGGGPAQGALEARAAQLGVQRRLVITGRVPHDEVPDYLAAMDVAVVADERTGVASPMKLLEYMAMGLAVVAPSADNIRDIVEDGGDGLLFAPGDPSALAVQLHRLADQTTLRRALGAKARLKIEQERNWRAVAETLLGAVSDRRPRPTAR